MNGRRRQRSISPHSAIYQRVSKTPRPTDVARMEIRKQFSATDSLILGKSSESLKGQNRF